MLFAAVWIVLCSAPVVASDIPDYDGPMDEGPDLHHYASTPCYVRGDIAYSTTDIGSDGAFAGEGGGGCSLGHRGLRADVTLGLRGGHDVTVTTGLPAGSGSHRTRASVASTTVMFNAYYDLRQWYGVTAYIGAGIGLAHNRMDDALLAQNAAGPTHLRGDQTTALAWSVMAGAAYRLSGHTTLDIGYRYIDLGRIEGQVLSAAANGLQSAVGDDLSTHEIKFGVRYNFSLGAPWR